MSCSSCQWGEIEEFIGPLGVDYLCLYECSSSTAHPFVVFMIFLWVLFLLNLLADTASNYFSPTLGSICSRLNLSYDIAGVSFLAFGNGAPDFFALLAAFAGSVDEMVGVGALLGGSVFISTIVVGCVAFICPCEIPVAAFVRDVIFFIIAVTAVLVVAVHETVGLGLAFAFLTTYVVYATVVVLSPKIFGSVDKNDSAGDFALRPMGTDSIQTAYWYRPTEAETRSYSVNKGKTMKKPEKPQEKSPNKGGYKFLILSDDSGSDDDNPKESVANDVFINLSGGYTPDFASIINEDFYSPNERPLERVNSYGYGEPYSINNSISGYSALSALPSSYSLNESLLSDENDPEIDLLQSESPYSYKKRYRQRYNNLINSLYWKQWLLRRKFKKSITTAEWWEYEWWKKVLTIISAPTVVLRDLSIPTLDDSSWSKIYAMLHPFAAPLLIAFLFGYGGKTVGNLPVPVICLFAGVLPSFLIFLLTHQNRPPQGRLFTLVWCLVAFSMCIFWTYLVAGELVTCLAVLGEILHIPPAYLGLTVLAWGNSLGDFFTNTAVAKQGLGEMAIAGCYGGPVFNILVGLGSALFEGAIFSYPKTITVVLDKSSMLSIVFLYISLLSTLVFMWHTKFQIDRSFGIYLISLYGVYTVLQALLLLV